MAEPASSSVRATIPFNSAGVDLSLLEKDDAPPTTGAPAPAAAPAPATATLTTSRPARATDGLSQLTQTSTRVLKPSEIIAARGGVAPPQLVRSEKRAATGAAPKPPAPAPDAGAAAPEKRPAPDAGAAAPKPPATKKAKKDEKEEVDPELERDRAIVALQRIGQVCKVHQIGVVIPSSDAIERMSVPQIKAKTKMLNAAIDERMHDVTLGRSMFNSGMAFLNKACAAAGLPIRRHPETKQRRLEHFVCCEKAPDMDRQKMMTLLVDRIYAEMAIKPNKYIMLVGLIGAGLAGAIDWDDYRDTGVQEALEADDADVDRDVADRIAELKARVRG